MPWLRLDDVSYDDPQVRAVGNAAYGALTRIKLYCSAQRTDGWIDTTKAREIASSAELRKLTRTRIGDGPPLLHQVGDECRCLTSASWPAEQGGYYVHDFLAGNPSRSENDVHRAKKRELKDPALKAAVKARDGDTCRYCGITVRWADRKTPAGGVFDHVDPKFAAGADNLVVACRGCNSRKQDCLPAEAGMTLRPAPGSTPTSTTDQRRINDRSVIGPLIDPRPDQNPDTDPGSDPRPQPEHGSGPSTSSKPLINAEIHGATTDGTGRGRDGTGPAADTGDRSLAGDAGPAGHRPTIGPATTPRGHLAPNPYLKTHTHNPHATGGPP